MAVFVPLANGVQVEIFHALGGEVIENRLWFTYDNPPFGLTELQSLTDGVRDWWRDWVLPYLSQDLSTLAVVGRDWTADPTPQQTTSLLNVAGGAASESSSANVALVLPFRWPLGVRLKRNKNYIAGIPEAEITLNSPSFFIRDKLFDAYVELIDATRRIPPVLNWRWVATSAIENNAPRATQLAYDVQGPYGGKNFVLGQRRKRLPVV